MNIDRSSMFWEGWACSRSVYSSCVVSWALLNFWPSIRLS